MARRTRSGVLRSLPLDDVESVLRWYLESREDGWTPHIHVPTLEQAREERVQAVVDELDAVRAGLST